MLKDDKRLSDYVTEDGKELHLVKNPQGTDAAKPAAAETSAAAVKVQSYENLCVLRRTNSSVNTA